MALFEDIGLPKPNIEDDRLCCVQLSDAERISVRYSDTGVSVKSRQGIKLNTLLSERCWLAIAFIELKKKRRLAIK